jgi:antibiotic biosynthesis monooxygenase (ABM) superfamily enzyme
VLSVIVRRFDRDVRGDVEALVERIQQAVHRQAGFVRLQNSFSSRGDNCELVTVFSFDTRDNLGKWENSPIRRELIEELDRISSGDLSHTKFDGLALLASPKARVTKVETVAILIFWILVMGRLLGLLADLLLPAALGIVWRDSLIIVVNVVLISYVLLPWSTTTLTWLKTRLFRSAGSE